LITEHIYAIFSKSAGNHFVNNRVRTDSKILFSRTFQDLKKPEFQGFPGLTKLVFNDFPGYIRFTNQTWLHKVQKGHISSQLAVYMHYSKQAQMQ